MRPPQSRLLTTMSLSISEISHLGLLLAITEYQRLSLIRERFILGAGRLRIQHLHLRKACCHVTEWQMASHGRGASGSGQQAYRNA